VAGTLEPAPFPSSLVPQQEWRRGRQRTGSWETFLKAHWKVMAAIDFATVEVWTKSGLVTFYLLFVIGF
jgi:hypothetical protein